MQKGMSKLQIRAEVLFILQQLSTFEDIPKYEVDKYIRQFNDSEKIDEILEILLKELARCDSKKSQIIAYFLVELGSLEKLQDGLWKYIKDPATADSLKDLSGVILKSLGDSTPPEELLSYLSNPEELVDNETQKLMELASMNPEAQIDFLDFLFSLPEIEQINLISSMNSDFDNQHIANILVPALEASNSAELSALIIDILGQVQSPYAVRCLNDIKDYSTEENLVKQAKKSLNLLKISGMDLEDAAKRAIGTELCDISKIYKCYASIIDGAGNQGIIVSRIKDNGDILTFSTIINDVEGIVDCFGFFGISDEDYTKIVTRFQSELEAVQVSPEYCKYKLFQAEQINKKANIPIRYEYISWKSLVSDVELIASESIINEVSGWSDSALVNKAEILFKHPIFNTWFLLEKQSEYLASFLDGNINDCIRNRETYCKEPEQFLNQIEQKVKQAVQEVFNTNFVDLYRKRLVETAFLFNIQGIELLRNIAASIAVQLKEINSQYDNIVFFQYLLKKSVVEHILRYQNNLEQDTMPSYKSLWSKKKQSKNADCNSHELDEILDILMNAWWKE